MSPTLEISFVGQCSSCTCLLLNTVEIDNSSGLEFQTDIARLTAGDKCVVDLKYHVAEDPQCDVLVNCMYLVHGIVIVNGFPYAIAPPSPTPIQPFCGRYIASNPGLRLEAKSPRVQEVFANEASKRAV